MNFSDIVRQQQLQRIMTDQEGDFLRKGGQFDSAKKQKNLKISKGLMAQQRNVQPDRVFKQGQLNPNMIPPAKQLQPDAQEQQRASGILINQVQILGKQQSIQYMSHNENSDSDFSAFENQSNYSQRKVIVMEENKETTGGSPVQIQRQNMEIQYLTDNPPLSARSLTSNQGLNSLNSSVISSIGNQGQVRKTLYVDGTNEMQAQRKSSPQIKFLTKVQAKPEYHPFADKLSPFEEWLKLFTTIIETAIMFVLHDICWNASYYTFKVLVNVFFFVPLATLGLMQVYLSSKIRSKCKKSKSNNSSSSQEHETTPFDKLVIKKKFPAPHSDTPAVLSENEDVASENGRNQLRRREQVRDISAAHHESMSPPRFMDLKFDVIFVVDLDHTLVFSQPVHSQNLNDSMQSSRSQRRVFDQKGEAYDVYLRPDLDKLLKAMSKMGQINIFTAASRSYADAVIDTIDPSGYITGRYYREHCKQDKKGQFIKPITEVVSKDLQKLIIIDDSEAVFEKYKQNTILVEPFTPPTKGRKSGAKQKDTMVQYCLDIFDQLKCAQNLNVKNQLQSIIESQNHYRQF